MFEMWKCGSLGRAIYQGLNTVEWLTGLLLLIIGQFLDGAALAEASNRTGQPFSQSVPRAFGTRRAGLQRAEGWLRLKVRHWLGLPVGPTDRIVFWKKSNYGSVYEELHFFQTQMAVLTLVCVNTEEGVCFRHSSSVVVSNRSNISRLRIKLDII